ncbi:MAG TPA: hypothetical protein VF880_09440 [Actinomycetes bacterium]|jgi:hypothetical protein
MPCRQLGTDGAQPSSRPALAPETRIEVVNAACAQLAGRSMKAGSSRGGGAPTASASARRNVPQATGSSSTTM